MANTYTQLNTQLIFATKYRDSMISTIWQESLHKYITGIIQNNEHKLLQINSMPDHIHILTGMRPHQSISKLVNIIKTESSKWIKKRRFCKSVFEWQDGYGAFSYSKSHVQRVIRYIQNQQTRHKKETFLQEYERLLQLFEVEYDPRYIFIEPI